MQYFCANKTGTPFLIESLHNLVFIECNSTVKPEKLEKKKSLNHDGLPINIQFIQNYVCLCLLSHHNLAALTCTKNLTRLYTINFTPIYFDDNLWQHLQTADLCIDLFKSYYFEWFITCVFNQIVFEYFKVL